jgi:GNAT superfamily N-acetyltransferase
MDKNPPSIRPAVPGDAEEACRVLRRSITECCRADHREDPALISGWLENKTAGNIRAWIQSRGYMVVAVRNGEIVGVAMLGGNGKIALLYLLPEVRFQGVGRLLLSALETEALARGLTALRVESTKTALSFYQRNGYVETRVVHSGFGLTAHRLEKVLGGATLPVEAPRDQTIQASALRATRSP